MCVGDALQVLLGGVVVHSLVFLLGVEGEVCVVGHKERGLLALLV